MKGVDVRIILNRSEFAAIRTEWDGLNQAQPEAWPQMQWAWFDIFWSNMDLEDAQVLILTAWDGTKLTGAAPLLRQRRIIGGIRYDVIRGLENDHSEYYSWLLPLHDPALTRQVIRGFLTTIRQKSAPFFYMHLEGVYLDTPAMEYLCTVMRRHRYKVSIQRLRRPPFIPIPDGAAGVEARLNKNMRRTLRSGLKALKNKGQCRMEEITAGEELEAGLKQAFALEMQSWKAYAGSCIAQDEHLNAFYREIADALGSQDQFRLFLLWCDEKLAAYQYCIFDDDAIQIQKISMNTEFRKYSPSHLMIRALVDWADAHGMREIRFGGIQEEFKRRWTDQTRLAASVFAFQGLFGMVMYMAMFGWKDLLKKSPALARRIEARRVRRAFRRRQRFQEMVSRGGTGTASPGEPSRP